MNHATNRSVRLNEDAYKGTALTTFLEWYVTETGPKLLKNALELLPEQYRSSVDPGHRSLGLLSATWYPAPMVHALLDALFGHYTPVQRQTLADRAGRHVIERLITGVYAGLFRAMASPALYAKYSPKLWSSYYRLGRLEAHVVDAGETRVRISDWPGHHELVCLINTAAAVTIFQRMGCLQVEAMRASCAAQGARCCEIVVRYVAGVRG